MRLNSRRLSGRDFFTELGLWSLHAAPGPGVLPHRLPAADPRHKRLCVGRADAAGAASHASPLPGRRGWKPSPAEVGCDLVTLDVEGCAQSCK